MRSLQSATSETFFSSFRLPVSKALRLYFYIFRGNGLFVIIDVHRHAVLINCFFNALGDFRVGNYFAVVYQLLKRRIFRLFLSRVVNPQTVIRAIQIIKRRSG